MNKISNKARHKARQLALQALYQLHFNDSSAQEIEKQFLEDNFSKNADMIYFKEIFHGVCSNLAVLDAALTPILDRSIAELTPVELAVLRMATFELQQRLDVPYRVVINEALQLTKTFGTADGYKYVNAVLDKLAKQLRRTEIEK